MSAPVSPKTVKFQDEIARDLRRQQQLQQLQQRPAPTQQSIGPRRSSAFQPPSSNVQYAVPHAHRHQSVPAQQQNNHYDEFVSEEPAEPRSLHQHVPQHYAPLPPAQRIGVLQQQVGKQLTQIPSVSQQQTPTIQTQDSRSRPTAAKVVQPRAVRPPEPTKVFQPIIQHPITASSTISPPVQSQSKLSPASQQMTSSFTSDLDAATQDLLLLSNEPSTITFSSKARLSPNSDSLLKSASTNSIHKVVHTPDGGVLKFSNAFTWDTNRDNTSPGKTDFLQ